MNTKNFLIGGLVGGVVYFLLGWLFYGNLMHQYFADHPGTATNVDRVMDQFEWWALGLGNLLFGFLLAYPMREMFLKWLKYPRWVAWLLPIEITLSVSAFYELIEWSVADLFFKSKGDAYLGTQGDIWDAQKDIFLAFCGAIIATTIVSVVKRIFKIHEQ